ncbi:MFS transporter [Janibacter sp. GS2]|uniref:MFS transporter n=1 Tax=Janibacter sp. GS2 TaxID=3442646 RepID=UPI003EBC6588
MGAGQDRRATVVAAAALLLVTITGTMSNNIINVPLRRVAADFDQPVAYAVLCVSAFTLMLAVSLPLTGWLGDRFGRKRVLVSALALMCVAQVAAALAPSLPFLIVMRALQGLGCSAIPPLVMGILMVVYPESRGRLMGAWAAANGVGQAIGPPVGGVLSDVAGWRSIFVLVAVLSLIALIVIQATVPPIEPKQTPFHVAGAVLLTSGAGFLLLGATLLSQPSVPLRIDAALALVGVLLLAGFLKVSYGNPRALIPLRLAAEVRFLRSCFAAFAQMFLLGTSLVAIPLVLTGPMGLSYSSAGGLFFVLPVVMAVTAPLVGRMSERGSPRTVLRLGLALMVVSATLTALAVGGQTPLIAPVLACLLLVGGAMAMVQTPAATGATRSPAGAHGAALGLFNLTRFAGMTAGAAWVGLLTPFDGRVAMFVGAAVIAAIALVISFAGTSPQREAPAVTAGA